MFNPNRPGPVYVAYKEAIYVELAIFGGTADFKEVAGTPYFLYLFRLHRHALQPSITMAANYKSATP